MTEDITIAVVDDHPLLREGVIRSLSEHRQFKVVAEGSSADDAVRIVSEARPDLLLLDLSMPGGGFDAIREASQRSPDTRIVVLTASEMNHDVSRALAIGAKAYILKGIGSRLLVEVLSAVHAGDTYVSPTLSARLFANLTDGKFGREPSNPIPRLSERELEVLKLAAEGKSNKRIALALDLQEKTVKHHMSRVFSKLGATNRTEASMILRKWEG